MPDPNSQANPQQADTQNPAPLFDMSKAQPIPAQTAAPNKPLFDMSKAQPIQPPLQATQPEQPGWLDRTLEGVKQSLKGTFAPLVGAVSEPQDAQEHAVYAIGNTSPLGPQGTLAAYRAAKTLVDSSEHMLKAPQEHFQQAKQDFIRAAKDLHDKNYLGMVRDLASASESTQGMDAGCGIGDRRPQARID